MDRRDFIKTGGAALAAGVEFFSFRVHAELAPASLRLAHLADLQLCGPDDPEAIDRLHPGRMTRQAYTISNDLVAQFEAEEVQLIVHSSRLCGEEGPTFDKWEKSLPLPLVTTPFNRLGPQTKAGFALIAVGSEQKPMACPDLPVLIDRIAHECTEPSAYILVMPEPLLDSDPATERYLRRAELDEVKKIVSAYPGIVLVLGSGPRNRADFLPGGSTLALATTSAVAYPCGGRLLDVAIGADGTARIQNRFLQCRLLNLVERSFTEGRKVSQPLARLGERRDREMTAAAGAIVPTVNAPGPNLAPWQGSAARIDLALIADTHFALDKFIDEHERKIFDLIGHATETDCRKLIPDVIAQVAAGRHRIEFYDQVFAQNPEADVHYLERPVDGVLLLGDVTEHGRSEEAEVMKGYLATLPERLRGRTLATPGNHDMWDEFSPAGMASSPQLFCDSFSDYGLSAGANCVVELNEWLAVIMLDTVVPTISMMALLQERIEWLQDQLDRLRGKVVMIAAHHDLYQLSLVPPILYAYLRNSSHFTDKESATRLQIHPIFAAHPNLRFCLSGHYHAVVADQFAKDGGAGFTTHLQTPCVTEYPSGYRLLRLERTGSEVVAEYFTAYTREWEIRARSLHSFAYRYGGTDPRLPPGYESTMEQLQKREGFFGDLFMLDPYDLIRFNVRGYKDGTANGGRGNGRLHNINDRVVFGI